MSMPAALSSIKRFKPGRQASIPITRYHHRCPLNLEWSSKALSDLSRLYDFLAPVNRPAAAHAVQLLVASPGRLLEFPRLGEKLEEFQSREVRRIIVGRYEMRYEIAGEAIRILRIWHTRERR